jgi:hypothetical protein
VFKDIAARGKTSVDWFFGLKLHLVINDKGELLNFQVTPGNVDDRKPVPELLQHLFGKVFADKGYISQKMFKLSIENSEAFADALLNPPKPHDALKAAALRYKQL